MSLATLPPYSFIAFVLLALALVAESLRWVMVARCIVLSSLSLAVWTGLLQPIGLAAIAGAVGLSYLVYRYPRPELYLVWITLLLAIALHALPGFQPLLFWQGFRSIDSSFYRLFWHYDTGIAGYLLLALLSHSPQVQRRGGVGAAGVGVLVLCLAVGVGYVLNSLVWSPSWPNWFGPWLFANFFLLALVQEALFRAGVQRWLELRTEPFPAIMAGALLYGLSQFEYGTTWMALSVLTGLGYGLIYAASRQVLFPALAHLVFNSVHLLLFAYPQPV